ncbi:MAG: 30S ribosomal protein S17e [Nanoarchaeota archaeon]|nr:30S ribosomal protein S17e [Nanoarchaeota archaeon]
MGRIKTKPIKRATEELIDNHFSEFSDKFSENKPIVASHLQVSSKKLRNIITGYVTRLVKAKGSQ